MNRAVVPKALQDRLGDDATQAFVYVLNSHELQMGNDILARIDARTDRLEAWLDTRFGEIDRRFGEIDRRFGGIDRRFGEVDKRFGEVDRRTARLEDRLDAIGAKYGSLAEALERGFGTLRADMSDQRAEILKWLFLFWVGQAFAVLAYSRVLQHIAGR